MNLKKNTVQIFNSFVFFLFLFLLGVGIQSHLLYNILANMYENESRIDNDKNRNNELVSQRNIQIVLTMTEM